MSRLTLLLCIATLLPACIDECPSGRETVELEAPALGVHFIIDKYEASRPDASASSQGSSTDQACSIPGVMPWTKVKRSTAKEACETAGMRLCTGEEWTLACQGLGANRNYPYGTSRQDGVCNGGETGATTLTGEKSDCITVQGVLDMSGNVREWTTDEGLFGGAFGDPTISVNLACDNPVSTGGGGSGDGFRCCKNP